LTSGDSGQHGYIKIDNSPQNQFCWQNATWIAITSRVFCKKNIHYILSTKILTSTTLKLKFI